MSIVNQHSVSFLRYAALGVGCWWGFTKYHSLVNYVNNRNNQQHELEYLDLVNEGKIAFEAQYNREQAVLAAKDGIKAIDSDSLYFNGEEWANWAQSRVDAASQKK